MTNISECNSSECNSSECNTWESTSNRRHWGLMAFFSIWSWTMFHFICKKYLFFYLSTSTCSFAEHFALKHVFSMFIVICFLNKGNIYRSSSSKMCVCCSCLYICFILYLDWFGRFDLRKGLHVRRVLKCASAYWQSWSSWGDPVGFVGPLNPVTYLISNETIQWLTWSQMKQSSYLLDLNWNNPEWTMRRIHFLMDVYFHSDPVSTQKSMKAAMLPVTIPTKRATTHRQNLILL